MKSKYFADIKWSKKLAHHFQDAEWYISPRTKRIVTRKSVKKVLVEYLPAVTTDMVLEKLPGEIEYKKKIWHLRIEKLKNGFSIEYIAYDNKGYFYVLPKPEKQLICDKKLPNVLCQMLEWLEKDGLL